MQLVRRALSVGFTLDELAKVLKVRDAGGAPCEEVRRLAAQKLLNVQEQLRELTKLRDDLQQTIKEWDTRLARRAGGKRANLLESLSVGAAVRISTKNPKALKAIHDFLRFQIKEHKTRDSLNVGKRSEI